MRNLLLKSLLLMGSFGIFMNGHAAVMNDSAEKTTTQETHKQIETQKAGSSHDAKTHKNGNGEGKSAHKQKHKHKHKHKHKNKHKHHKKYGRKQNGHQNPQQQGNDEVRAAPPHKDDSGKKMDEKGDTNQ